MTAVARQVYPNTGQPDDLLHQPAACGRENDQLRAVYDRARFRWQRGHVEHRLCRHRHKLSIACEDDLIYIQIVTPANGEREQVAVNRIYCGTRTIKLAGCDIEVISSVSESKTDDGRIVRIVETDYSPDLRATLNSRSADAKFGAVAIFTAKDIRTNFVPFERK